MSEVLETIFDEDEVQDSHSCVSTTDTQEVSEDQVYVNPDEDVLDLLSRWNKLSKIQKQTFSCLCQELDIVSELIESNTTILSERFNSVIKATNNQTKHIDEIISSANFITDSESEKSLPNIIQYLDDTLDDGITKVVTLSKESIQMVYDLEDVIVHVKDAVGLVKKIEEINKKANLLALNAKIESARAGDAGKGFAVVSDEMKELSLLVNQMAQDISEKMDLVSSGLETSFTSLKSIANIDMTNNIKAKDHIDDMLEDLMQYNQQFNDQLQVSSKMSATISSDISELVTGFQFQDRATQYLETIKVTLNAMNDYHDTLGATETGSPFEREHYQDEETQHWIRNIMESFPLDEVRSRFIETLDLNDDQKEDLQIKNVGNQEKAPDTSDASEEDDDSIELF